MNFKDLENVEHRTVLVDRGGTCLDFIGFTSDRQYIVLEKPNGEFITKYEDQIKDWTIKKPEPETIVLFEFVYTFDGNTCFLTAEGKNIRHIKRGEIGYDMDNFIKVPSGRTIEISAETFEVVG